VAKRLSSRYLPGQRLGAWRKIKPLLDLPCVVIGYRVRPGGQKELLVATLREGKLTYVGAVERGVPGSVDMLPDEWERHEWERRSRSAPVVACPQRAQWVEPERFCLVRCHGFRPSGVWRDPEFRGWLDDLQT